MKVELPSQSSPVQLLNGDVWDVLRQLPAESVHCCVTSPPYWGLRDYGVAGQLGLEKTRAEYVAAMVDVFREVKRVLRNDGTLWLNIGDSYNGIGGPGKQDGGPIGPTAAIAIEGTKGRRVCGLKPKDLCGIPWRLAFALQADGWYLRSDVIWHKPNAMPESVTDRPSKAHEYLFLFSKRARYFYDGEAIREPNQPQSISRASYPGRAHPRGWHTDAVPISGGEQAELAPLNPAGRNRRSVWSIVSDPYPEAHFATFPPKLVEPCVRAGTSLHGCCQACGGPWKRVVERNRGEVKTGVKANGRIAQGLASAATTLSNGTPGTARTTGWQPSCHCDRPDVRPCVVLDPFCGSGTTGQVALQLDRWFVGIDLNAEYLKLAEKRIREPAGIGGLFDPKRPEMADLFEVG